MKWIIPTTAISNLGESCAFWLEGYAENKLDVLLHQALVPGALGIYVTVV